ncbi:hypothetical protein [Nonomuraea lactucae]|uniref:hypothetical protein n=1 Tax=Nonomuraea lactucae TaxID=2249762 RepID=UPI0013B35A7D|nr:hypothetical protein [Nonomuraea lactucae]
MFTYVISKDPIEPYNPGERWTAFSDIGSVFGEHRVALSDYLRVENAFLQAVHLFSSTSGADQLQVRRPEVAFFMPPWLPSVHDGKLLTMSEVDKVCKAVLRDLGVFVELAHERSLQIKFGFDLTMHVATSVSADEVVAEIRSAGLHVRESEYSNYFGHDDWPVIETPADNEFWRSVSNLTGHRDSDSLFILERWAHGRGGEKWYRTTRSSVHNITRYLSPRSLVTAFSDLDIFLVRPHMDAIVEICGRMRSSLDEEPLVWVRNYSTDNSTLAVTVLDNFAELQRVLAGQKETLAFFFYPEIEANIPHLAGVLPDPDGCVRSIWPK